MNSFIIKGDCVYLFLTQEQKTIIDKEDLEKILEHRWHAHWGKKQFYARTGVQKSKNQQTAIRLHQFLCPNFHEVDHINRNGLDNRKKNLREGAGGVNQQNVGLRRDNTSGFKGVRPHGNKWRAIIQIKGKKKHLGLFNIPRQAATAYENAVRKFHQ